MRQVNKLAPHHLVKAAAVLVALSGAACIFDQGNPDKQAGRLDSDDQKGNDQGPGIGTVEDSAVPPDTSLPDTSVPDTNQPDTADAADAADTG